MQKQPHNPGMSAKAWDQLHEFIARVTPEIERREAAKRAEQEAIKKGA
ncbi:hypothetical protein [Paenibacillus sp. 1P03SA]